MAIFIGGVSIVFGFITGYANSSSEHLSATAIRSESSYLYNVLNNRMDSSSGDQNISGLGLLGNAYVFEIVVNNSRLFYRNQNQALSDLSNEIVYFDMDSIMSGSFDDNSLHVYDQGGNAIPYSKTGHVYGFSTNISMGSLKTYFVYFDRTSNFTGQSHSVSGADNITEEIYFPRSIDVVQYNSMQRISAINYSSIRNGTNFNISVAYLNGTVFWSYGTGVARNRDLSSFESPVLFQDADGAVRHGRLIINVW